MAPSVCYSITVRLEAASRGRAVSEITRAVEQSGGVVTALDVTAGRNDRLRADVCDDQGSVYLGRPGMDVPLRWIAENTNRGGYAGNLDDMLIAAARALADMVSPDEIGPHYIIPSVFHPDVASSVAVAVGDAATQNPER